MPPSFRERPVGARPQTDITVPLRSDWMMNPAGAPDKARKRWLHAQFGWHREQGSPHVGAGFFCIHFAHAAL